MNTTELKTFNLGYKSTRSAKMALKIASFSLFIPLVLMLILNFLFPGRFYGYLYFNDIDPIVLYSMSSINAVLGIFILKEKLWAANLACFLLIGNMIFDYFIYSKSPSGMSLLLCLLLVHAIRANYYLNMNK
ncbi:hypothetical protein ACLB4W_003536 [Vibrio cholerae]|uniref:hypothetical protein n=1 Tax=Vibrio cholerae TaxID=666 RepID=UPI0028F5E93C|nr:hypothetical protein [Vibrio cholerae]ELM0317176.1 hypothetical protein [Vibrio cholerae]